MVYTKYHQGEDYIPVFISWCFFPAIRFLISFLSIIQSNKKQIEINTLPNLCIEGALVDTSVKNGRMNDRLFSSGYPLPFSKSASDGWVFLNPEC